MGGFETLNTFYYVVLTSGERRIETTKSDRIYSILMRLCCVYHRLWDLGVDNEKEYGVISIHSAGI